MNTTYGLVTTRASSDTIKGYTNKLFPTTGLTKNIFSGSYGTTSFFSHFNPMRRIWEYLMMFLSLVVPMEAIFVFFIVPEIPIYAYAFTFLFDIIFSVDIYINRRTAILHNGEILTKPKKIAKVYGRTAFIIQIISCIPLGWIGVLIHNRIAYIVLSLNRFLRLHRGWRAFRTSGTLLPYVGGPMSILPVIFFLVFAVDIFSTIMVMIAEAQKFENSWLAPFHERGFTKLQSFFVSIYFVMTTILTIGFGDISPVTTPEVVVTIFVQLIGVSMHAGMTSMMVAILIDPAAAEFVQRYNVMQDFLKFKKVNKENRTLVHNYYQYQYERTGCTGNVKHILKTLPASLRSTIKLEMTKTFFQLTNSFASLSNKQLVRIVDVMSFKTFSPGDVISVQGEKTDRIFFFKSGILAIIIDGRSVMTQSCNDGTVNGEYEMFHGLENPTGLRAVTYVEAWLLKVDDMKKLMQDKEDVRFLVLKKLHMDSPDSFQSILRNFINDETTRKNIEKMVLNSNSHSGQMDDD